MKYLGPPPYHCQVEAELTNPLGLARHPPVRKLLYPSESTKA